MAVIFILVAMILLPYGTFRLIQTYWPSKQQYHYEAYYDHNGNLIEEISNRSWVDIPDKDFITEQEWIDEEFEKIQEQAA